MANFDDDPRDVLRRADQYSHGAGEAPGSTWTDVNPHQYDQPIGPHRVSPDGLFPYRDGLNFRWESDQNGPGQVYIKDDYAYRCRGANRAAGLAAAAAITMDAVSKRKIDDPPLTQADLRKVQQDANAAVAAVCHTPDEQAKEPPIVREYRKRQKRGGSPFFQKK